MKKHVYRSAIVIITVTAILFLPGCGYIDNLLTDEQPSESSIGSNPSAAISFPYRFDAPDLYGNPVTETSLGEKEVFFVHLWATWCPPCVDEMPDFPQLIEMYGDRVGFLALLTDYEDNPGGAQQIVEKAGIPDSFIMIDAFLPDVAPLLEMLDSGYVPTTVLISASGAGEQIIGSFGMGYADFLDELLG